MSADGVAKPPREERLRKRRGMLEDALNLPNALTMARIVVIPLVLWLLWMDTPRTDVYATLLYAAAAVTDLLDGYLARRLNLITVFGKYFDPLADKLLVLSVLVVLVDMARAPAWAAILIIAREVSVTSLRAIASSEGVVIAASGGGKFKAALQMVALVCLLLHHRYVMDLFVIPPFPVSLHDVGLVLLYTSVVFSVTSAYEYVALFADAVDAKNKRLGQKDGDEPDEPQPPSGGAQP